MRNIKILFLPAIAVMIGLSGCQKEETERSTEIPENTIRFSATDDASPQAKTALDEDGKTMVWSPGDKVRVIRYFFVSASGNSFTNAEYSVINIDGNKADLTGSLTWAAPDLQHRFHVYYPDDSHPGDDLPANRNYFMTSVSPEQVQNGTTSTHIGTLDALIGTTTVTSPSDISGVSPAVDISFKHLYTMMEFDITGPANQTITAISLTYKGTDEKNLALLSAQVTIDATTEEVSFSNVTGGKTVKLTIVNMGEAGSTTLSPATPFRARMMVKPGNYTSGTFGIAVTTDKGVYPIEKPGRELLAGKRYLTTLAVNIDETAGARAIDLSNLPDFTVSNVYNLTDNGIKYAEICKEYIETNVNGGEPAGEQRTVVYPHDATSGSYGTGICLETGATVYYPYGTADLEGSATPVTTLSVKNGVLQQEAGTGNTLTATADVMTDASGNTYGIVKIGTQYWMRENLKTTKKNDGTDINTVDWTCSRYASNLRGSIDVNKYGYLYGGGLVADHKLAPAGWREANTQDWLIMLGFTGYDETTPTSAPLEYLSTQESGSDKFGLGVRLGGYIVPTAMTSQDNGQRGAGSDASLWMTAYSNNSRGYHLTFRKAYLPLFSGIHSHIYMYSVRCVRN